MKSLVKSLMILCFLAATLLGPVSLKLAGSGNALAVQADDGILSFFPAILGKRAPILQSPVVSGTSITLTWTFNRWPSTVTTNEGYRLEQSTSPTGPFSEIAQISGRQSPKSYLLTRNAGIYYYRVRVFYNPSYSPYCNVVKATVTGATTVKTTVYALYNVIIAFASNISWYGDSRNSNPDNLLVGLLWQFNPGAPPNIPPSQDFVDDRSVLFFNIQSMISGKTINRAILRLYPNQLALDFNTTYELDAISQSWSPDSITWNTQPLVCSSPYKVVPPPTTLAAPLEIDVTDMVQLWANGTWNNYGFVMYDTNFVFPYASPWRVTQFDSLKSTNVSRRPQLYLEYQ
jgi:hypothetical protein